MCSSKPKPIPTPPPPAPTPPPVFGSGALFGQSKEGLLINKGDFQNLGTKSLQINKDVGRVSSSSPSSPSSLSKAPTKKNPYLINRVDSLIEASVLAGGFKK